ncbi:30S ribosome-binding factor RbfA [Sinimarinibacterium sp. CAU 1509]|uniref:30S ribosome-binding factor RbfA n=1 Tax=Sinimarinibacterium sp. CAU 1509 TaxID=2562283 RepID=UPI0010AD7C51|nr:30S ribosome-binding factor RbfA [Sinimarinibacterium sp. CAU 1509]TJY62176.1 30S ribosome-binding factor RbfA [Sinimarinibacterium sp. CAU 1509]
MKEYSRKVRLNTQLRTELAALIRTHLSDPRVLGVTVTEADVSPDMRSAKISVSLLGDDARLAEAVMGLNHAAGRLRRALGVNLRLRYTPMLRFVPDVAMRQSDRMNVLIRDAVRRDAERAAENAGTSGDRVPSEPSPDDAG